MLRLAAPSLRCLQSITYPHGCQILNAHRRGRTIEPPRRSCLIQEYLASFGELRIPTNIWRALERSDAWIEPALTSEWVRLIKAYAESQDRRLDERVISPPWLGRIRPATLLLPDNWLLT